MRLFRHLSLSFAFTAAISVTAAYGRTGTNPVSLNKKASIVFLENIGQITDQHHNKRNDIDFCLKAEGMNVFIGKGIIQYQWNKPVKIPGGDSMRQGFEMYAMYVTLEGANTHAELLKEEADGYHENYYTAQIPGGGTAYSYKKIIYRNIYPEIDWVIYIQSKVESRESKDVDGVLKYDFIVHPGGNPADIKLVYHGDSALIMEQGSIVACSPYGNIIESAPVTWQYEGAIEKPQPDDDARVQADTKNIDCSFVLDDSVVRFEAGVYDKMKDLVIDPAIRWATYYGGGFNDELTAVATQHGYGTFYRMYIAGRTLSNDHIAVWPAHMPPPHQAMRAEPYFTSDKLEGFIAAFSFSGNREWATYFGGDDHEFLNAAVCDKAGNIIVAGGTKSDTGISTMNALKPDPIYLAGLMTDGFIAKFDSSGKRLWGRYTGGESWEEIKAMAIDADDNLYVTGETYSVTGIGTPGTHMQYSIGAKDVFVEKYNSNATKIWGSYYGSKRIDISTSIVADNKGSIYLGGNTFNDTCDNNGTTDTGIATPGAHKMLPGNIVLGCPIPILSLPPPLIDGFIAKLDANTGKREWGTYYGGSSGDDYINTLAFDSTTFRDSAGRFVDGLLYAGGVTHSNDSGCIATHNGIKDTTNAKHRENSDGFVVAFRPDGSRYWGTYLGGASTDAVYSMCMDRQGALHVVGSAGSSGLASAMFSDKSGVQDGFHATFNHAALQAFTYIGGENNDMCSAVVSNDADQTLVVGNTMSATNVAYWGVFGTPHQPTDKNSAVGYNDGFLASFDDHQKIRFVDKPNPMGLTPLPFFHCLPPAVQDSFVVEATAYDPNTLFYFEAEQDNVYTVQMSDSNGSFEQPIVIGRKADDGGIVYITSGLPDLPYGVDGYKIRVLTTRPLMISRERGLSAFVRRANITATVSSPVCEGDTIRLSANSSSGGTMLYEWVLPDHSVLNNVKDTFLVNAAAANTGIYIARVTKDLSCVTTDTNTVIVRPKPTIVGIGNSSPVCEGEPVTIFADADTTGGGTFSWTGPGFSSGLRAAVLENPTVNNSGTYYIQFTKYGCSATDSTIVKIDTMPKILALASNNILCYGDTIQLFSQSSVPAPKLLWRGPGNFSSSLPVHHILSATDSMSGYYRLTTTLDKCSSTDSVYVLVKPPVPPPDISSNSPVKAGEALRLYANGPASALYSWAGPDSFFSNEQNPVIKPVPDAASGQYYLSMSVDGCTAEGFTVVIVNTTSEVVFELYPNPNNGNFTIEATLKNDQVVAVQVVNAAGQLVYENKFVSNRRLLTQQVQLPGLASGVYFLHIRIDGGNKVIPFSISK